MCCQISEFCDSFQLWSVFYPFPVRVKFKLLYYCNFSYFQPCFLLLFSGQTWWGSTLGLSFCSALLTALCVSFSKLISALWSLPSSKAHSASLPHKIWFRGSHQCHSEACYRCRLLGPTPDLLHWNLPGWSQVSHVTHVYFPVWEGLLQISCLHGVCPC